MSHKTRWSVLLFLLAAALVCYGIGMVLSAQIIFAIGVLFELAFWCGLFRIFRNSRS